MTVTIDATDQLERGQLSALEMILYPKSGQVMVNAAAAMAGTLEVVVPEGPLMLFVWGGCCWFV